MKPTCKEMLFNEAVTAARELLENTDRPCPELTSDAIIELVCHPGGVWTVRWSVGSAGEPVIIHEEPLNLLAS